MQLLTKTKKRKIISFLHNYDIRYIRQNYNEPAKIFCGDRWITSACVRCTDARCIKYTENEIRCNDFKNFAYERKFNVCPVDAIEWDFDKELPQIIQEKCINCGLCAVRCPIGAIFRKQNQMIISEPVFDDYINLNIDSENIKMHKKFIEKLDMLCLEHRFQYETDTIMENIYEKISCYDGRSMIPNIFVRNLIIALKYNCAISRNGDVYTRMDAIYSDNLKNKCSGVIEIEFGKDTLEASRNILDDVAMMHLKNILDKNNNMALVVCYSYPNKRQGYFQVIKDIKRVLNLKIQTLSIGALLILIWNGVHINFLLNEFYVDFDNLSIREIIEKKLKRKVCLSNRKLGILEPEK